MSAVLERMKTETRQGRQQALSAFDVLAKQLADGDKKEPGEVNSIISAADKSFAELERAVALYEERPRQRAIVSSGESAEAEIVAARAEIRQLDDQLAEAQRRHQLAVIEVNERIREIQQKAQDSRDARDWLCDPRNCPVERLAKRLTSVREAIQSCESAIAQLTASSFDQQNVRPGLVAQLSELRAEERQLVAQIFDL